MRFSRLAAGTVSAALLGLTPIAIAAPSHATDNLTTTTVATPSATEVVFGDEVSVSVDIDASNGSAPSNGTATLYALEVGSAAYVPVATSANVFASFLDVKPKMTTSYKVVYTGYTATTTSENNYTPSESAPFTVSVARKITNPDSGFVLKGKVTPDYAKKRIVIQVSKKVNKAYKRFATIKTDRRGKYRITLPKRRGTWYWSVSVRADSKYLGNGYVWRTLVS